MRKIVKRLVHSGAMPCGVKPKLYVAVDGPSGPHAVLACESCGDTYVIRLRSDEVKEVVALTGFPRPDAYCDGKQFDGAVNPAHMIAAGTPNA